MKVNLKIFVALALVVATLFWAVDSIRARSYAGTDLKANVGQGAVTVTNGNQAPVTVQLVSPGTRVFNVTSTIANVAGPSIRQGTGSAFSQLFEFAVPPGVSQFTVTRGTNVSLVTTAAPRLDVSVQSNSDTDTRTTLIAAAVVVLAALYYISRTTGHRWIARFRGPALVAETAKTAVVSAAAGQGVTLRPYGDNREHIVE